MVFNTLVSKIMSILTLLTVRLVTLLAIQYFTLLSVRLIGIQCSAVQYLVYLQYGTILITINKLTLFCMIQYFTYNSLQPTTLHYITFIAAQYNLEIIKVLTFDISKCEFEIYNRAVTLPFEY